MSNTKWYYIIREKDRVFLTAKKPEGLSISQEKTLWFIRNFEFLVGCPDPDQFIYADNWYGPIGVFNINDPKQVLNAFCLVQKHTIDVCRDTTEFKHREHGIVLEKLDTFPRTSMGRTPIGQEMYDTFNDLLRKVSHTY